MISKLGEPPIPASIKDGQAQAKVEHVWHAARRYAQRHGYRHTSTYGVEGVAPT